MRPTAFPIFIVLGLGLPALTLTGCKGQSASVDPGAAVELPSKVEDFDAFVEGLNVLVRLTPDDPRFGPLRTELRDWVVPYVLERLADGAVDEAESALTVAAGMYRAAELQQPTPDAELTRAARKLYAAAAAAGHEIHSTFALGVVHQFGGDEDKTWAERQFTELEAWVASSARYADEPGAFLDLETVLEEASADFPTPWLHTQLERVLLERYREARRGAMGARRQQAEYTGYILARAHLRADDFEAARDTLASLDGNNESDQLQAMLDRLSGKKSDLPVLIELISYFQPSGASPLPPWVENQSWGIVENLGRRVIAIDARVPAGHLALARAFRAKGLSDAAIAHHEVALDAAEREGGAPIQAWSELAGLYQERLDELAGGGDADSSRRTLETLESFHKKARERFPDERLRPGLSIAYVTVASDLYNDGKWEDARTLATRAVDVEASAEALDLLGTIAFKRGELELAREAFSRIFELAFEGAASRMSWEIGAHLELAEVEAQAGELAAAQRHYKGALRHLNALLSYPELDGASRSSRHVERARIFFALGDLELAMADFRSAMSSAPNDTGAYVEAMMLFVSRGYLEQAGEIYNRAMTQDELGENLKLYLSFWMRDLALRTQTQPDPRASEFIAGYTSEDWTGHLARHGRGELDIDGLLKLAKGEGQRAEAYFYEGMRRAITQGDAAGLALMAEVEKTGMMSFFEYEMARRFLVWKAIPRQARAPQTASAKKMVKR